MSASCCHPVREALVACAIAQQLLLPIVMKLILVTLVT